VGTSLPTELLTVRGAAHFGKTAIETTGDTPVIIKSDTDHQALHIEENSGAESWQIGVDADGDLNFYNSGSVLATMALQDANHFVVGTEGTATAPSTLVGSSSTTAGSIYYDNTNYFGVNRNNGTVAYFNRTTGSGNVITMRSGGSNAFHLGFDTSAQPTLDNNGNTAGLKIRTSDIIPRRNSSDADNLIDLGDGSYRFDDVFATNGTIQTSDRNEKQDIEDLSEAELRVATAAKGLIKKYRWIDAVQEKGDDARIHVGIIAQDLQAAFEAEGLDASRYAMFTSDTWWEADRVVPASEANEVEGIEAVEEHTVTDKFDTQEEAPEGAIERTRLGVRYPELLAFIIGAM